VKTIFKQALLLLLLALLPALCAAVFHPLRPGWKSGEVTLWTARAWVPNVLWIDARPAMEYRLAHIEGAVLLNEDGWDELLPAVLEKWSPEQKVVVYCSSQSCAASHEVARRLREEAGLPEVFVMEGGWEAWEAAE